MDRNIAVVGCGYWGKNLVRNFAELGALHTICDTDQARLKALKKLYPSVKTETDYAAVLANSEIKGVVLATLPVLHHDMAKQAMLAGKDVMVEKPLALNVKDGKDLVDVAGAQGRVLMVGHLLEYHPAVRKLRELVGQGELGKIQYIYSNRLNLGKFRSEENILWSFAPHDISAILLLLGGEMPVEVTAQGGYYLHRDIADVTVTLLSFKSGVRAHIFVSWLHPYKEQKLVVVGDKKMAEFNDTNPKDKLQVFSHAIDWVDRMPVPRPGKPEAIPVPAEEPLKIECQDFTECIATRKEPRASGRKGLQVLEILAHCQQSLESSGKPIALAAPEKPFFVHESSLVEQPVEIGDGTKVWHFCHVMPGATIGKNCVLGQNVFVAKSVKLGNNVKVENNVSLFEGVTLEDDVFCGPSCVFTNVFNPRSHVSRKHEYRPTLVKRGATIGANSVIVCGNTIGRYAFVGAGAVVTSDLPDYALVYGNPARRHGWMCECGVKLKEENNRGICPACGKTYTLDKETCTPAT